MTVDLVTKRINTLPQINFVSEEHAQSLGITLMLKPRTRPQKFQSYFAYANLLKDISFKILWASWQYFSGEEHLFVRNERVFLFKVQSIKQLMCANVSVYVGDDYIYNNKKKSFQKYTNVIVTFLVFGTQK